ncbi:MAG: hypothetical protein HC945_01675, partial [Nitrosarchaeum sp.]|nr:hypothetical protein [Nitrosarchaeum sp.]
MQPIGAISPEGANVRAQDISSLQLQRRVDTRALRTVPQVSVSRSMIGDGDVQMVFDVPVGMEGDAVLSFNVLRGKGTLGVRVNGELVFMEEVPVGSPLPIAIPRSALVFGSNNVTFFTDSPGMMFWSRNEYVLSNVIVAGRVVDLASVSAERMFAVAYEDLAGGASIALEVFPTCEGAAAVSFFVNGGMVASGPLDCNVAHRVDLPPEMLRPGTNVLGFVAEQGSVLLERGRVLTTPRDAPAGVYYFAVPPALFNQLSSGRGAMVLTLRFAEPGKRKVGTLNLNGYLETFDTMDVAYQ